MIDDAFWEACVQRDQREKGRPVGMRGSGQGCVGLLAHVRSGTKPAGGVNESALRDSLWQVV